MEVEADTCCSRKMHRMNSSDWKTSDHLNISPISWHGEVDGNKNRPGQLSSSWHSTNSANYLDILALMEKDKVKEAEKLKFPDKSEFLKRMNLDKYQNISDLDKLCVYQMKRKLVETVIEEQYAMDNIVQVSGVQTVPLLTNVDVNRHIQTTSPSESMNSFTGCADHHVPPTMSSSGSTNSTIGCAQMHTPTVLPTGSINYFTNSTSAKQHVLPTISQSGSTNSNSPKRHTPTVPPSGSTNYISDSAQQYTPTVSPSWSTNYTIYPNLRHTPTVSLSGSADLMINSPQRCTPTVSPSGSINYKAYTSVVSPSGSTNSSLDSPQRWTPIVSPSGSINYKTYTPVVSPFGSTNSTTCATPPIVRKQSYFDRIIIDQFESENTSESDNEDEFIDVDDSGMPDANSTITLTKNANSFSNMEENNFSKLQLQHNVDNSVSKFGSVENKDARCQDETFDYRSNGEMSFPNEKQDDRCGLEKAAVTELYGHRVIPQLVTESSDTDTCVLTSEKVVNVNQAVENESLSSSPKTVVFETSPEKSDSDEKARRTPPKDSGTSASHAEKTSPSSRLFCDGSVVFGKGDARSQDTIGYLSPGQKTGRSPQESVRRGRGRRKMHAPLHCRKRNFYTDSGIHASPNSHLNTQQNPKHHFPGWPAMVPPSDTIVTPFGHSVLNYMYPYTTTISGSDVQNSFPVPMSVPSSLPLMATAYPLPLSSQVIRQQPAKEQAATDSLRSHGKKSDDTDRTLLSGLQSGRPPFTSQRFDAGCDQYDPVVLNQLFQQWCAIPGQNRAIFGQDVHHYPSSYSSGLGTMPASGLRGKERSPTIAPEHLVTLTQNKESSASAQASAARTEINSNEELTQYFNLLFNPSEYRPKDKLSKKSDIVENKDSKETIGTGHDESDKVPPIVAGVSEKSSSREDQKGPPAAKFLLSIDLTDDDSADGAITKVFSNNTNRGQCSPVPTKDSGVLPISVTDELWSAGDSGCEKQQSCDPDLIIINSGIMTDTAGQGERDVRKNTVPVQPYEPKYFQNLPRSELDKMSFLESFKKWTVDDMENSSTVVQSNELQGHCEGEGHDKGQGQEKDEKTTGESSSVMEDKSLEEGTKKIAVLDAMHTLIAGLLDRGPVDLSFKTKAVNKLFEEKLNGISTPCKCTYRRRPVQMSRSMAAHANALNRAAMKQAQASATLSRPAAATGIPMKSPQRSQVVFPEMMHQEESTPSKPKTAPSTITQTPPSPLKKAKIPTSTIKHYGPMQMIHNVKKPLPTKESSRTSTKSDNLKATKGSAPYQHPQKLVYGNFGQCLDMPVHNFSSKSRQLPFILNQYPPFTLLPNANAMYNEYLISQKRSLDALQRPFYLPTPVPMKRQRLLFGEEAKDLNVQAMCSV